MILESLGMAIDSLRSSRLRTFLSLSGIVIGVASVVAIMEIAASGTADVRRQFESLGLDAVQVYPGWRMNDAESVKIDDALIRGIRRDVPGVKNVLSSTQVSGRLSRGRLGEQVQILAVESPYFMAMNAPFAVGGPFKAEDEYSARARVVLGSEIARNLFPEGDPVGKTVAAQVDKVPLSLVVTGVLLPKDAMFGEDWNNMSYIPLSLVLKKINGTARINNLLVLGSSPGKVLKLGSDLERFLTEYSGSPDAFYVASPGKWAEENNKATKTISVILAGIASISLLVGGIGVMNTMLVSVGERRREVGIRKAIGAENRHILLQFLTEAALLTVSGGFIGLGLGTVIGAIAVKKFGWEFQSNPAVAALALAVSMVTGLISGIYPAMRAAKLDPVRALAEE